MNSYLITYADVWNDSHQDGMYIGLDVRVQANASLQQYLTDEINLQQAVGAQFQTTHQGPYTTTGVLQGFQTLSEAELQGLGITGLINSNRTNQAHLEYLFFPNFYPNQPTPEYAPLANESYICLAVGIVAAQSTGIVSLKSNSLGDGPAISLNVSLRRAKEMKIWLTGKFEYLSNHEDLSLLVYGFKNLRKILNAPQIQQYAIGPNGGEVSPGLLVETDDQIAR